MEGVHNTVNFHPLVLLHASANNNRNASKAALFSVLIGTISHGYIDVLSSSDIIEKKEGGFDTAYTAKKLSHHKETIGRARIVGFCTARASSETVAALFHAHNDMLPPNPLWLQYNPGSNEELFACYAGPQGGAVPFTTAAKPIERIAVDHVQLQSGGDVVAVHTNALTSAISELKKTLEDARRVLVSPAKTVEETARARRIVAAALFIGKPHILTGRTDYETVLQGASLVPAAQEVMTKVKLAWAGKD
ncbi:hypothetical protein J8273_3671 [Carpediemonas membranifera]|uniref:Uncharacterized protein n=1 Tax=Carpediemonas membranifera TaxID=201153 RepID=A0A8J6B5H6_9EUKA|nr:hypothetical protein J8273_3671 [Carpediemonas membranifera]|eukprot:KAG9394699.1 hypothetical protein J8273_3671 [Carpediemonas membranifera]